jgi:hypothetical protein
MQIELTVRVELPDTKEEDGKVYVLGYSETDIVDAVADLDYSFSLDGQELETEIIDISYNDSTLWSA